MTGILSFLADVAREPVIAFRAGLGEILDWLAGPIDELPEHAAREHFERQERAKTRPACWWGSNV